jgi:general nucleoside transport system permease protein
MSDIFQVTFIVSLLTGMLRLAAPIILASIGELVTERSGVLNLGVEGTMLMGAFAGFLATSLSGSIWVGVLWAILSGGILSAMMALVVVVLKADQIIAGLTINILSAGVTMYLFRVFFSGTATQNLPTIETFEEVAIPLLSEIPFIGPIFFNQHVLTYMAVALTILVYFFLYHTKYGLILRSIGDNPRAVDMKGVRVERYQFLGVVFGGMLAGLGGSFMTLASAGLYSPGIIAGRGWIALAIVILGNWKPFSILAAALFFGLLDTFQLQVQGIGIDFPYQILVALPYLLTIVVLIIGRAKSGSPLALGVPYKREG